MFLGGVGKMEGRERGGEEEGKSVMSCFLTVITHKIL